MSVVMSTLFSITGVTSESAGRSPPGNMYFVTQGLVGPG